MPQEAPLAPSRRERAGLAARRRRDARRLQTVRALLDAGNVDVNAPGRDGTPALHWAVRVGDRDTAQRLVAAGADVNVANRYGVRRCTWQLRRVTRSSRAGCSTPVRMPRAPDRAGEQPLVLAAHIGDPAIAQALLEHGAAADTAEQHFGQTPLMVAARDGNLELAKLLIDAGADVNAQTAAEQPPRFIPPSESPEGLSRGAGIIRAGWPEGRGKRFPAGGTKTPLLYATRAGHLEITRLLVERGASLELADGNGITPLINAIVNASIFRVNRTGDERSSEDRAPAARRRCQRECDGLVRADASLGDSRHAQPRARLERATTATSATKRLL